MEDESSSSKEYLFEEVAEDPALTRLRQEVAGRRELQKDEINLSEFDGKLLTDDDSEFVFKWIAEQKAAAKEAQEASRMEKSSKLWSDITAAELGDDSGDDLENEAPAKLIRDTNMLADVVNNEYTMADVHTSREGVEGAMSKDPVELSPMQLLWKLPEEHAKCA